MFNFSFVCVITGLVLLGIGISRFVSQKNKINNIGKPTNTGKVQPQKKSSWAWPIIIAIALTFWSMVFALFFLAIVWVMRLNPKTESKEIPFPSDKDRKRAKGTYTWLLLSPFLNVVVLLILVFNTYSSNTSTNEWVMVALVPLLLHLPLLIRLDSNSTFVFRHTQQAILLLALRASIAALALNFGRYPEDGIWLFLIGNGSLWLFGSIWGRNQAHRGTSWWIGKKGETILSQEFTALIPEEKQGIKHAPEKNIEYGKWYLKNNQREAAREYALRAFRLGNPDIRSQAVLILSNLGEVEKF